MKSAIYKRGQGKYTRLCSAFGWALVVALGCLALYRQLRASDISSQRNVQLWVQTLVPVGLFLILSGLIFWIINKPGVADFMIAAEGEMKKVSWSSRKEIAVSTLVVIIVVFLMAVYLGVMDFLFQMLFMNVFGI